MLAWRVRQVRVHVPRDTPQWCIDNGEDDLIPCGSSETGKERASQLVETLNLGHTSRLENPAKIRTTIQSPRQQWKYMRNARRLI